MNQSLGIIALNRAAAGKTVPIELMNNRQITDGKFFWPERHLFHDQGHHFTGYGLGNRRIHNFFESKTRKLNKKDREKAEIIYFMLEHERIAHRRYLDDKEYFNMYVTDRFAKQIILQFSGRFELSEDKGGFLPKSVDPKSEKQIRDYLESAADTFTRMLEDFKPL